MCSWQSRHCFSYPRSTLHRADIRNVSRMSVFFATTKNSSAAATISRQLMTAFRHSFHRLLTISARQMLWKLANTSVFRLATPEATRHPKIFLELIFLVCANSRPSTIRQTSGVKVLSLSQILIEPISETVVLDGYFILGKALCPYRNGISHQNRTWGFKNILMCHALS